MSEKEFARWVEYYRAFPFDDFHRFHRPAAMIAQSMGGGDIEQRLEWLQPGDAAGLNEADLKTMKAFGFKPGARS